MSGTSKLQGGHAPPVHDAYSVAIASIIKINSAINA